MHNIITIFPNIKQPNKKHEYPVLWEDVVKFLTKKRPHVQKMEQVSWSPYTFKSKRCNADAEESAFVVFDFDTDTKPMIEISKKLEAQDFLYCLHMTSSSTAEKQKYRLIMPMEEEIAQLEQKYLFRAMCLWAKAQFDMQPDQACKDPARAYYTSYCNKDGFFDCYFKLHGKYVNWANGIRIAKKQMEEDRKTRKKELIVKRKKTREQLQELKRKGNAFLDKPQQHITRSDEKRYMYALAECDPSLRETLANKLDCNLEGKILIDDTEYAEKATGFVCPFCNRSDATFYYIDPTDSSGAFCAHVESCSDTDKYRFMNLGYIAEMAGVF